MKVVKEELGEKTSQVNLIEINLDKEENYPLGSEYKIKYVPTIFFMDKNDQVVETFTGAITKEDVLKSLKNIGVE